MAELFRYWINGAANGMASTRLATRAFIEAVNGQVIKGSGRTVDDALLVNGEQAIQGFTGEQIAYLRDLISLGAITASAGDQQRAWLSKMVDNRLVAINETDSGRLEYAITPLGRAAVKQLL